VAALALSIGTGCGDRAAATPEATPVRFPVSMEDLTVSAWAGAHLAEVARARLLVVAPASFGPFQVAMVDEMVMAGVSFDLYLDEGCADEGSCPSTLLEDPFLGVLRVSELKGGLPLGGARLIDVRWVVWRGNVPVARFSAREATVRRRGGALELREATLEHLSRGRVLEARRAVWEPGSRSFAVRDGYTFQEGETRLSGERARLALSKP
jgi:hypothetical protein